MPLRRAFEISALLIAGAILVIMLMRLAGAENFVLANGQPVFGDFIAFWSAGRAALEGHADQVHDRELIFAYHQIAAPGVRFVASFNSPPTFLVIASALALLPYPVAALVFFTGSGALYFFAARKLLPDARALIFAATLPAAFFHLGTVQVGLLVAGLSGLALYWLDKRPFAAGALVGLLAFKPHLALLWPLFLALSGRWGAFAAAAVTAAAFVLLAGFVFGFDAYTRFFASLGHSQALVSGLRITTPAYASLYANLLDLGVAQTLALGAHGLSAAAGVGVALYTFIGSGTRGGRNEAGNAGAALCAATLLISPYLFFYDFTLLAVGAALLGAPRDRFELASMVAAWSAGLSLSIGYYLPLPVGALSAWFILLAALRRVRGSAYPRQRTPDPPRSAQS